MKNIRNITFALLFTSVTAYGQQQTNLKRVTVQELTKSGSLKNLHIYNDKLDKFAGKWIGNKNGKQITLILSKKSFRLTKDTDNLTEMELISGSFQYLKNGILVASYDLKGSINTDNNVLNLFLDIKSRNSLAMLSIYYLQNGNLKLEYGPAPFEARNDKDFEFKDSIVLNKQ